MRILVTGGGGFVGRHLIDDLLDNGHEPIPFDEELSPELARRLKGVTGDVCDVTAVRQAIEDAGPDACIHLAAVSFVPSGQANPALMLSVNVCGTVNLLEAVKALSPDCRVLVISTAQVYGPARDDTPVTEDHPLVPISMYAISKAAADLATLGYARNLGLQAMTARPLNHTGPGQSPRFVIPSFVEQIRAIARQDAPPRIKVGNLQSRREFMDVRDVVRAYRLLVENGTPGLPYNIASRHRVTIGDVLERLCELAKVKPDVTVDPERFRPTDSTPLLDVSRLQNATGWEPEITLDTTLSDMLAAGN